MTPFVQMLRINPKLPRERLRALPAQHPLDCRKLKLPAENTAPSLGHSFSLRELVPYILVSLSGGTPVPGLVYYLFPKKVNGRKLNCTPSSAGIALLAGVASRIVLRTVSAI